MDVFAFQMQLMNSSSEVRDFNITPTVGLLAPVYSEFLFETENPIEFQTSSLAINSSRNVNH